MSTLLNVALLASTASVLHAQTLLQDDFSGGLDPTRWSTVTGGVPCCGASVFPLTGACAVKNRGHLVTAQQFNPVASAPIRISGTFSFSDPNDLFAVATRSDATPGGCCGWSSNGIFAVVWPSEVTQPIRLQTEGTVSLSPATLVSGSPFQAQVGVTYSFTMVDLGASVWFTVTGGDQSATLRSDVLADSTSAKFVEFFNREEFNGDHQVLIDDVTIAVASPSYGTVFGTGCGSPIISMAPRAGFPPALGHLHICDITNALAGTAWVAVGLSNEFAGPSPLPIPLDGLGLPGCTLWHSADLTLSAGTTPTSFSTAMFALPVPADPLLTGLPLFLQAYTLAPGYNALGLVTSNGVGLVLGSS